MTFLAGVDAGASHTEAVLAAVDLAPIARQRGGPGALVPGRVDRAAQIVLDLVRTAMRDVQETALEALVVGAAGAGLEANRTALVSALEAGGVARRVLVTTDGHIALHSAFGKEPGIVLSAGTGSIGLARDPAGELRRSGGHGWRLGDEGSGYALARAALGAAAKATDGRGPATALTGSLPRAVNRTDLSSTLEWARDAELSEIAALATVVLDAAEAGDSVARGLVTVAGRELAAHVHALLGWFPEGTGAPIALAGGLLGEGSPVRGALLTALEPDSGRILLTDARVDPTAGALALARDLMM